jgi:OPA family glycerol-3-phosphate transporter-like MFS transporter
MNTLLNKPDSDPLQIEEAGVSSHLGRWQKTILAILLIGYSGYYLCRSDLSIATPLLLHDFGSHGLDKARIGMIASIGTMGYAAGKFINGVAADKIGGRKAFLTGMGGAVLATLIFAIGGLPVFSIAWVLNRLIQSSGWVGMVKLSGKWFSYSRYGAVMSILSLSYLFGDFFFRLFLGRLVSCGLSWKGLFLTAGGVLGAIYVVTLLLLKESPKNVGEPEPHANPDNVYGQDGDKSDEDVSLGQLLAPLLKSSAFWIVCALSFGLTLVREAFGNWSPDFLTEVAKMTPGAAGSASSLFPLFGGISVLVCGYLSDKFGKAGRATLILGGIVLSVPLLLALGFVDFSRCPELAETILAAVGFVTIGPYAFLAGAIALDFGGKRGSSTAAGMIDGIGYIGGILAGAGIGDMVEHWGWRYAFLGLTVVLVFSCIAAGFYWKNVKQASLAG